ncbi:MAG: Lrp/AsnC ligand binding domain-containing protein [OCS116 cluster bacterium]|uniref:ArsR family transcriptional regulator n=1 Tax=OCS116 cluster bacterium TaxID=2030921 RepID=A0A2A4Z578_9PROT|nr:Lrp/AsnC ligand binding domain-containing protein [OCS116 cluster bacterium]
MKDIDPIDCKILSELQKDGRISNAELSEKIHLSPSATAERTKRLQKDGYIKGYYAKLCPTKLNKALMVFIEVKLNRTDVNVFNEFNQAVQKSAEIMECHMLAGGFDYLIKARVKDMDAYRNFLGDVLLSLPGVRETHTYPVMEEVKDSNILPLG